MVDNKIHYDLESALMGFVKNRFEIFKRSVFGIDAFVIGNIVAEILLRRRIKRRKPDCVNAYAFDIIKL